MERRPFPVGARVKRVKPPPGVVVGYLKDDDRVVVRWDGTDLVSFLPPSFIELDREGESE